MTISDDFSAATLDPAWSFSAPAGAGVSLGTDGDERFIALTTPDGNFDQWGGNTSAARLMQATADEDFALSARFLSTPTDRFQMQGFLVQGTDANDWIRVDTYSDGGSLRLFAAVTVDGVSSIVINAVIPGGVAPYLTLDRSGDTFTISYSVDGETWIEAVSFDHAIAVAETGLFAGNTAGAAGFTAEVDWFEVAGDPLTTEDGFVDNTAPVATDDALATDVDTDLVVDVEADLLANDTDADLDALSLAGFDQPANGSLVDNGDGTLTYTPDPGFNGTDTFTYTVSDGLASTSGSVSVVVGAPSLFSDDFSGGVLDPSWNFVAPDGASVSLQTDGDEQYVALVTPDGNFDLWGGTNNAARLMQATADEDFTLAAHFLSTPTDRFQMQGLLVQGEEADDWIRVDTYSDGNVLRLFTAVTVDGGSSIVLNTVIPGGSVPYLSLDRSGDTFTVSYSLDGATWTEAASFDHAIAVAEAGVFAGNTAGASGFTAEVDWFSVSGDPLATEDGIVDNADPVAGDDALATDVDMALVVDVATDLLGNDSDPDFDALSLAGFDQPANGTLADNGDGTLTYTPNPGFNGTDTFTYTVSDGLATTTGTVTVTVGTPSLFSDDFSGGVLDPSWSFVAPDGASVALQTDGEEQYVALVTPDGNFDQWGGANNGARLMQATADEDFGLSARFLSTPTERFQMQGLLVQGEEADDWIRVDTYSDGSVLRLFGAVTVNGSSSVVLNTIIPGGAVPYLALDRSGDTFTVSYSLDGSTWIEAGSFNHAITVAEAGVFAGNTGGATGFTAEVDWFAVDSDPFTTEDGADFNTAPIASDDALVAEAGATLSIDVAADLLANDTDRESDPLSLAGFDQPAHGTIVDNGDGTLSYVPDIGFVGTDSFSYTVTDGDASSTATVTVTVEEPVFPTVAIASDDFSGGALGAQWAGATAGGSWSLASDGTQSWLELSTTGTAGPLWGANDAAYLLQEPGNGSFDVIARFLDAPDNVGEAQGLLVSGGADDWISFGLERTLAGTQLTAVSTAGGVSQTMLSLPVDAAAASHLRVSREGDTWSLAISADGVTFTTVGTFDHAIDAPEIGPYAAGALGPFTTRVDYVTDASTPITVEDGNPLDAVPVAGDDTLATAAETPLIIDKADLLANDTDADGHTLVAGSFSDPENGTLVDNGDGTLTYTPDSGFSGVDTFTYLASDGTDAGRASVSINVGDTGPTGDLLSDDFSDATLDPTWTFLGIDGGASLQSGDGEAWLEIESPEGVAVDAFRSLTTPRVLQPITDRDFQITAKFLNEPETAYQEHGLLVVEDDSRWLRFDLAHTPSGLKIIVGTTDGGSRDLPVFKGVASGAATYLRVTRVDDTFTFEYSADGENWTVATTRVEDIAPTAVGVFAGSTSFDGPVPGFTSQVDWFETSDAPLTSEDGTPPLAADDALDMAAGTTLVIDPATDLAGNDTDAEGDPLTVIGLGTPDSGTLTDNGDGTYTFEPDPGFSGVVSFTYEVSDGTSTTTGTAYIGVREAGNDTPTPVGETVVTTEGEAVSFDPLANDTDPNGDTLTILAVSGVAHGLAVLEPDGTVTYTPSEDFFGTDTVTYVVTDGRGGVATATATIEVAPVNDAPVAGTDTVMVDAGGSVTISIADLLSNDTDADEDPLSLVSFDDPVSGTLVDNGDGTLTYTPRPGYFGLDGFTYVVGDGSATATGTVEIAVAPTFGFVSDDFSGDVTGANWQLEGPVGTARLVQEDGEGYLEIAVPTGTHDVWNDNNAPRFMQDVRDTDFSLEAKFLSMPSVKTQMQGFLIEQDADNWIRFDVLHNGAELRLFAAVTRGGSSQAVLNVAIAEADAAHLRVVREGDSFDLQHSADGITWVTAATLNEDFTVTSAGLFAATAHNAPGFTAQVDTIKLTGDPLQDDLTVPAAPVAEDDLLSTTMDVARVFDEATLLANDTDQNGDTLDVIAVGTPEHGMVQGDAGGYIYIPDAGFTGVDRFTYTVSDGDETDVGVVLVEVDNVAPTAIDDLATTDEDGSVTVDLIGNDTDPNGDALTVVSVGEAANGTVTLQANGTALYVPDADWFGTDTFTYVVSDGVRTSTATATVTVSPVEDAPVAVDDAAFTPPDSVLTIDVADLLANDEDADGDILELISLGSAANGTIVDNGDGTLTYTPDAGFSGTDQFTYTITDGNTDATATVTVAVREAIELWHGETQTFGSPYKGQEWINILGNVASEGLVQLSYRLDGGEERQLGVGPDTRRLQENGDFNVDISYDELDPTAADNIVTLIAEYADGSIVTRDVTVDYEAGAAGPADYDIDWDTVTDLQDVVQVVDGTWAVTPDGSGVRPVDLGYDRLLVVGDDSWDNYEVRLQITMNDLQNVDPAGRDGGALAIGMLWGGHTDAPVKNFQPKSGWEPGAAFFATARNFKMHSYHDFDEVLGVVRSGLSEDTTYEFVVRVEQTGVYDRIYSLKVWEVGTPEPEGWTLQTTEVFAPDEAPVTGSIYLNAHYHDVTFHDLSVREIEGSDIINGTDADELFLAVDTGAADPGRGEIDVFTGGAGADTFVFGDAGGTYYDDGDGNDAGHADYAFIWDFDASEDVIRLHGSADDYIIGAAPAGLAEGLAIFRDDPGEDELIAIVRGPTTLDLYGPAFEYTDAIV